MNKKLFFLLGIVLLLLFGTGACTGKKSSPDKMPSQGRESDKKIEYYTCSMHPFIHEDKPGRCPICHMELVPVYSDEAPSEHQNHVTPESRPQSMPDRGSIRLSPEKQQLIGVKTNLVERRPLVREINASGRVAYDPDLIVAQNEYLAARKFSGGELGSTQNSLIRATEMRLKLLGMSESQIQELRRRGKAQMSLLVPQKGESVWIYGSIFESDLPWVKVGDPVQVFFPGSNEPHSSKIESFDPTIDPMTRTARMRLRIFNPDMSLKPDMYVKLMIQAQGGDLLTVPDSALLATGTREIAFVDLGDGKFEPRDVKIGRRGSGYVEVVSGLSAGERVVTSANFLIDSESQLKAALSGMGGGGHEGH